MIFRVKPASLGGPNLFPGMHTVEETNVSINALTDQLCQCLRINACPSCTEGAHPTGKVPCHSVSGEGRVPRSLEMGCEWS